MKGDFTRFSHDPGKHYTGVLKQQGRIDLDADWNEQVAIQDYLRHTLTADVVGGCSVPARAPKGSFRVDARYDADKSEVAITSQPGRIYVDGILCELDDVYGYTEERKPVEGETDLVYLEVWQRNIMAVEDPDIREVALGGPDTTTRIKTELRLRVMPNVAPQSQGLADASAGLPGCEDDLASWPPPALGGGRLTTKVDTSGNQFADHCAIGAEGGYSGLENRLYRVEIHEQSNQDQVTFKWSRDNGAVLFPVKSVKPNRTQLELAHLGRDRTLGLKKGDWVEVISNEYEIEKSRGFLTRIDEDPDESNLSITLEDSVPEDMMPLGVRRWDGVQSFELALLLTKQGNEEPTKTFGLEHGIEIAFSGEDFRSGDYWVFTARTASGDIEVMVEAPPQGIHRHYCKLALLTWRKEGPDWLAETQDCRQHFPSLTQLTPPESCCTVRVGENGDVADLQKAIDALQDTGGRVCLLPGDHHLSAPVVINRDDVTLIGCGRHSQVFGPASGSAFRVSSRQRIRFEGLWVEANSPEGVLRVDDGEEITIIGCRLIHARRSDATAPYTQGSLSVQARGAEIVDNRVQGGVWLRDGSSRVHLLNNDISGGSASAVALGGLETDELSTQATGIDAASIIDNRIAQMAAHGIWIRDGATRVRIKDNEITEGGGAGVLFGGLADATAPSSYVTGILDVSVINNRISQMGLSGIATHAEQRDPENGMGDLEDLEVIDNRISQCVRKGPGTTGADEVMGGIVLYQAEHLMIRGNTILDNGAEKGIPSCGIFVSDSQDLDVVENRIWNNGTPGSAVSRWVDFTKMQPGAGKNPREESGISFEVFDSDGNSLSNTQIQPMCGYTGLNCENHTKIKLPQPANWVSVSLGLCAAQTITVRAFSGDSKVDSTVVDGSSNKPETVGLTGADIDRLEMDIPQDESLLLEVRVGEEAGEWQAGIVGLNIMGAEAPDRLEASLLGNPAARIHDNSVLCPSGHALILLGAGPFSVADNNLTTHGLRAQPIWESAVVHGVLINNLGVSPDKMGFDVALNPGVEMRLHFDVASDVLPGSLCIPPQTLPPSGRVLFHGNQVTLRASEDLGGPPFSINVGLLSADGDISLQDNQFVAVNAGGMVADVVVVGMTVRATGNRFSELPNCVDYSYVGSSGLLNTATDNQSTHCLWIQNSWQTHEHGNLTLLCNYLGV